MTANKKKILFLTGTRADFGKLKSLISSLDHNEQFESYLFVTGMHMLSRYGSTYIEVENSGFKNIHKHYNQHIDEPMEMILANTIQGLSRYVHEVHPDMIVIHGDRVEALAGAIVGSICNIFVMHIEGGERSGTIDEQIRHSITKLSHVHLVANEEAKQRVIQMGENPSSVFVVGSADVDFMKKSDKLPNIEQVKDRYHIPFDHYHIALFHPVTTELEHIKAYADHLVDALLATQENYVVIYPNNDHGTNEILAAYQRLNDSPHIRIFPSIRFEYFLTLIHHANSIIGNSSAGIREAPIFGVPSVNIGSRQNNRFSYESITNCSYETADITAAIEQFSGHVRRYPPCNYFGDGNSSELFLKIISDSATWHTALQKIFVDIALPETALK